MDVTEETPIHGDIVAKGDQLLSTTTSPHDKQQLVEKLNSLNTQWEEVVRKVQDEKLKKEVLVEKCEQLERLVEKVGDIAETQMKKVKGIDPITCSAEKLGEQQNESKV